jgi:hypothetical protein
MEDTPEQEQEAPAFYAVIPATVRYDRSLPPNAKLLYGEITALCNKKGYCWASNAYFAYRYGVCKRSIIQWINRLHELGYINVKLSYAPDEKWVQRRLITLPDATPYIPPPPGIPPDQDPGLPPSPGEPAPPRGEGVNISSRGGEKIFTPPGKNLHQGVKKSSPGGENFFTYNITSNIKKNTSSSPPPAGEEEVSSLKTKEELEAAFAKIDPRLVFNSAFYPRAAAFLAAQGFSAAYLSWVYEFCQKQKPRTLLGFYYTLFFSEQAVELYRRETKERAPPLPVSCPVCGCAHAPDLACPICGLEPYAPQEEISRHALFWNLPDDMKSAFTRRREEILGAALAFQEKLSSLDRLRQEYGLA